MFRSALAALAIFYTVFAFPLDGIVEEHRVKRYSGNYSNYSSYGFEPNETAVSYFNTTPSESENQTRSGGSGGKGGINVDIGTKGASISHQQTLLSNDKHQLNGKVYAEKGFDSSPVKIGGNVDYTHKPSSSVVKVGASHSKGSGTDLSASGQYNFWQLNDGKVKIGAYGEIDKNFGGPSSNPQPKWNVGITGKINF